MNNVMINTISHCVQPVKQKLYLSFFVTILNYILEPKNVILLICLKQVCKQMVVAAQGYSEGKHI